MTMSSRDKRALAILGAVLVLAAIYWIAGSSGTSQSINQATSNSKSAAVAVDTVDGAEKRLANMRVQAAKLDAKETLLKQASTELAEREKGLIPGDTAEQAQAQLLQILKRVAKVQSPPLEIRQLELGQPRLYGDAYGKVTVSATIDCRIDEIVNFLATLSAQPEITATDELRFGMANPRQKTMPVRVTVSGLVARRLVPEKKGMPAL